MVIRAAAVTKIFTFIATEAAVTEILTLIITAATAVAKIMLNEIIIPLITKAAKLILILMATMPVIKSCL